MSMTSTLTTITDAEFAGATAPGSGFVAVDFWAEWCGACRMMTPVVEATERDLPGVRFFAMDADANPVTAARLGVRSLPTTLLLRDGEVVDRIVGAFPAKAFRERLERSIGR